MKKIILHFLFLLILLAPTKVYTKETHKIKVACIGNSITYGAFISNREKNNYPTQLQAYLGSEYEVRNFGVNGITTLTKGNIPYIKTHIYKEIFTYQPDILLIKLGTNDAKAQNWKYKN